MITEKVYDLTHSQKTLTTAFAADPNTSPGELRKHLYTNHHHSTSNASGGTLSTLKDMLHGGHADEPKQTAKGCPSEEDLDRAAECGQFGRRPSDLFLKIYHDILCTLDSDPWAGSVSPPLLGSRGVVNLTIISVIPDIIQHHYDCIVGAESEVFLATNFWEASKSATKICDAFIELSRRAEKRGKKVVVKMMYDRANLKMLAESHVFVLEKEWTGDATKLPKQSEMPWLDFQLVNFHQPVFGTFHSKFMIVDRKVALLCSNNIQDRPNMEMMVHLEGPIVDSMYDVALLSWSKTMNPPLPLLAHPNGTPEGRYKFGMETLYWTPYNLDGRKGAEEFAKLERETGREFSSATTHEKPFISGTYQTITEHLNAGDQPDTTATIEYVAPASSDDEYTPHILHAAHEECPMALVNRAPNGKPGNSDSALHNGQDAAWLAALKYAKHRIFIQSPTFNAVPVVDGVLDAVRRGIECVLYVDVGFNDGGEALPGQGGINEEVVKRMYGQLNDEEKQFLKFYWYTGKDQEKPINAHIQKRNCHVKVMVVDDMVGIAGNGNQDTQSWYHSQEVNVMIDNPAICRDWLDAIRRNENTHLHQLGPDGIYRDKHGNGLTDSTGVGSGIMGVIKGIQGSIARARGTGGF